MSDEANNTVKESKITPRRKGGRLVILYRIFLSLQSYLPLSLLNIVMMIVAVQ